MTQTPRIPEPTRDRVRPTEPMFGLVQALYAAFERPAPKHLASCACALCADRDMARRLQGRAARDWSIEDVVAWTDAALAQHRARKEATPLSRSDRAVFRFLLPRLLELLAAGGLPRTEAVVTAFAACLPGRTIGLGPQDAALTARLGALVLDRAVWDAQWPMDVVDTMHLLVSGGWSLPRMVDQVLADPDLPSAVARAWGRRRQGAGLFDGAWPHGAVDYLQSRLINPHVTERVMNYAMADGPTAEECDAAMRAADRILRKA